MRNDDSFFLQLQQKACCIKEVEENTSYIAEVDKKISEPQLFFFKVSWYTIPCLQNLARGNTGTLTLMSRRLSVSRHWSVRFKADLFVLNCAALRLFIWVYVMHCG